MIRCINFQYVPIRINVVQATEDNPVYRAALMTHFQPYQLTARLGRISEDTANAAWAKVYAEAVIVGSPDEPYRDYTLAQWCRWLEEHPEELGRLRALCSHEENFHDGPPS